MCEAVRAEMGASIARLGTEEPAARNMTSAKPFVGRSVDIPFNGWGGLWADSADSAECLTGRIIGHNNRDQGRYR